MRTRGASSSARGLLGWVTLVFAVLFTVGVSAHASAAPAPAKPKSATSAAAKPKGPAKAPAAKKKTTGTVDPTASPRKNSDVRQSDLYGDRLDALQTDVDGLKDRIFRSKARLSLLKETVLRGVMAGSRVILAHRNLMGSGFKLVRVVYVLDGAQIYARNDETGSLDTEDELVIIDGNLPPGPHSVRIELTYQGHGYGVFSYMSSQTYTSNSDYSFTAPENGAIKVLSSGFESGNLTTEMIDRPAVDWQEQPLDASGRPLPKQRRRSSKKSKGKAKASAKKSSKKK
ncbi:MAG: hypothetical protein AAGA54_28750 [Myxococcota bacterium]